MPKKKLTAREKREALKKERLARIAEKAKAPTQEPIIPSVPEVTETELKESATKFLSQSTYDEGDSFFKDASYLRKQKSELQEQLDSFRDPEILEMPEFLTDPSREEERTAVFEKINYLLKRRFSLVAIADVLETNDYDRLDEMIETKDRVYKLVEEYTSEEGSPEKIRLFSKFKKVVGDDYSKTYAEQEEKMKATIKTLSGGKYFKKGMSYDEIVQTVEDIVANVIDGMDFNLACQIETEFINYELTRTIDILSDLHSRSELQALIAELRTTSKNIEERSHAYTVMDMLITRKKNRRSIINLEASDDNERGGR